MKHHYLRTSKVLPESTRNVAPPLLEPLEGRLLLDAAPVFATALDQYYAIGADGRGLTIGIDGFDADDGDILSITAVSDNAAIDVFIPDSRSANNPDGNRFALLTFVNSDGSPAGEILAQLTEGRSGTATDRFITLATNEVVREGFDPETGEPLFTLNPADVDHDAFYTDVPVHRVIPEFMIQTGDAFLGDGTGDTGMGSFEEDFGPSVGESGNLSFAGNGTLAFANAGLGSSDGQFFITQVPTAWLNDAHVVFGQVVAGQTLVDELVNRPRNASDQPLEVPLLASVEIIDSPQDGTITLVASADFAGSADVTVTLRDAAGNETQQVITVVSHDDAGAAPIVVPTDSVDQAPGETQDLTIDVTYDGTWTPYLSAFANHENPSQIDLSIAPGLSEGEYTLTIALSDQYDGKPFTVAVSAALAGFANVTPNVNRFEVAFGERPQIFDPGLTEVLPNELATVFLEIADDEATEFDLQVATDLPGTDVQIDPDTFEVSVTPPVDYVGIIEVTVSAMELDLVGVYDSLAPTTQTIYISTHAERPVINSADTFVVSPMTLGTFQVDLFDESDAPLAVDITTNYTLADVTIDPDTYEVSITTPTEGFYAIFYVTITAVEDGELEGELLSPTEKTVQVVIEMPGLPVGQRVPTEQATIVTADGDWLFLGRGAEGVEVYDTSIPDDPLLLGSYSLPVDTNGYVSTLVLMPATIDGEDTTVVVVAAGLGGLITLEFDPSDPGNALRELAVNDQYTAVDIALRDQVAYVAAYDQGLVTYDLSTPTNPTPLARIVNLSPSLKTRLKYQGAPNAPERGIYRIYGAVAVELVGNYVLVGDQVTGLLATIRAPAPDKLYYKRVVSLKAAIYDMAVEGDYLYATTSAGLISLSVANPSLPKKVDQLAWGVLPTSVTVANQTAVIGTDSGYSFIDVSDPRNMRVGESFVSINSVGSAAVDGDNLWLALSVEGALQIDGTTLTHQSLVRSRLTLDLDGVPTTITISGGGEVRVTTTESLGGQIELLEVLDATSRTSVKIRTQGNQPITIGTIDADGDIRRFNAPNATLTGDMTVAGAARTVTLGGVLGVGEQNIAIGVAANGKTKPVKLSLGQVTDLRIDSAVPISVLSADQWLDDEGAGGDDEVDAVTAPWIKKLSIGSRAPDGIAGHFEADLVLDGTGAARATLGTSKISGNMSEAQWDITGGMGPLTVGGFVRDSAVRTTDSMARLALGAAISSDFLAGVDAGVIRHADSADDFANPNATIGSITIKGIPDSAAWFLRDSTFSASRMGATSLVNADFQTGQVGLFAADTEAGREIRSVRYKDTVTGETWIYPPKAGEPFEGPDGFINLL